MIEIEVRSLEYLRELSRLVDDWQEDSACQCCDWALSEIERLRKAEALLRTIWEEIDRGDVDGANLEWMAAADEYFLNAEDKSDGSGSANNS